MPTSNSSEMTLCDYEQADVDLHQLHADALTPCRCASPRPGSLPGWYPRPVMGQQHVEASVETPGYVGGSWHILGVWVVLSVSCLQRLGRVIPSAMCRPGRKAPDADEVAAVTPTQHTRTHPAL